MREVKYQEGYWRNDDAWWIKAWNHWLNPFGNYHEPLPFPDHLKEKAPDNIVLAQIWWALRNFAHNFTHFWLGIIPRGDRYEWITPDENGWTRVGRCWKKKGWSLCRKSGDIGPYEWYIGWARRGSWGVAFRKV